MATGDAFTRVRFTIEWQDIAKVELDAKHGCLVDVAFLLRQLVGDWHWCTLCALGEWQRAVEVAEHARVHKAGCVDRTLARAGMRVCRRRCG